MFFISILLVNFLIGLTLGFWIRGLFRDFFSSTREYHLHMGAVLSTFILAFSTIIHHKQYLSL
jgi:multisubunit Na+/H+ antiporter MnhE subunit